MIASTMPNSNKTTKRMTLAAFHGDNGAGTPSKPAGATSAYKAPPQGVPKHAPIGTTTGVSTTTAPPPKPTAYQRAWADVVGASPGSAASGTVPGGASGQSGPPKQTPTTTGGSTPQGIQTDGTLAQARCPGTAQATTPPANPSVPPQVPVRRSSATPAEAATGIPQSVAAAGRPPATAAVGKSSGFVFGRSPSLRPAETGAASSDAVRKAVGPAELVQTRPDPKPKDSSTGWPTVAVGAPPETRAER
ncbi:MAG: hypothetical protein GY772_12385 [bacterium]|nr:hypothetical protein [bacterium]